MMRLPVLDTALFARNLAAAWMEMWRVWSFSGAAPMTVQWDPVMGGCVMVSVFKPVGCIFQGVGMVPPMGVGFQPTKASITRKPTT